MLRPTHASPNVPKVDVHEDCVPGPSFRRGTNTELVDDPSFSILSPAVRVPRIFIASLRGNRGEIGIAAGVGRPCFDRSRHGILG